MSGIIRAARVSVESRILPVPQALPPRPRPAAQPAPPPPEPASDTPPPQPQSATRLAAEELEALRRQAMESGREQGLQQGRAAGERECSRQIQLLRAVVEESKAAHLRALDVLATSATDIVLVAVGKILGDAFANHEAALAAVRETLRRCHDRSHLRVCVAPGDFEVLSARHEELLERTRAGDLELVADERVALGGCIVESVAGRLDARLEVQIQRLDETLRSAREQWTVSESESPA